MSTTTDLSVLKINYLTQEQYDAAFYGGTLNPNELYITPSINMADWVVEEGTKGSSPAWRYRKWNSGKIEAWVTISKSAPTSSVWASPIRYVDISQTIPSGLFTATPTIYASHNGSQYWVSATASSTTNLSIRLMTVASNSPNANIAIYAVQHS